MTDTTTAEIAAQNVEAAQANPIPAAPASLDPAGDAAPAPGAPSSIASATAASGTSSPSAPATEPAHGLAHLEEEFLAEWRRLATFSETEAKKLLAWIASKL